MVKKNKLKKTNNPEKLFILNAFKQLDGLLTLKIFTCIKSVIPKNIKKINENFFSKFIITNKIAIKLKI